MSCVAPQRTPILHERASQCAAYRYHGAELDREPAKSAGCGTKLRTAREQVRSWGNLMVENKNKAGRMPFSRLLPLTSNIGPDPRPDPMQATKHPSQTFLRNQLPRLASSEPLA